MCSTKPDPGQPAKAIPTWGLGMAGSTPEGSALLLMGPWGTGRKDRALERKGQRWAWPYQCQLGQGCGCTSR